MDDYFMDKVRQIVDKALEDCGNDLLNKSRSIAPIYTGSMISDENSFTEARHESDLVRCQVVVFDTRKTNSSGYNYAVIQHENSRFKHKVGQWKFLETPYKENIDSYKDYVVRKIEGIDFSSLINIGKEG